MGSSRVISGKHGMFQASAFNQDIGEWKVSNVTNMRHMFAGTPFNQNIGEWNVSNVTNMSYMFIGSGFNKEIGDWKTGNVTTMEYMFRSSLFNQNIGGWDVSNVTDMSWMFDNSPFDQNISRWDVSNVRNFDWFFQTNKLSTENYNKLLVEWSKLDLYPDLTFYAGHSKYDLGEPADRKQYIIDQFGWTIYDGGCWCVTDVDYNTYPTIMIDETEWMTENLRVTRYNDFTNISSDLSNEEWSTHHNNEEGAVAVYDHEEVEGINSEAGMAIAYGRLYNWYAVVDARGLCPAGWRVPTNDEWSDMVDYLMTEYDLTNDETDPNAVGNALKSCRQVNSPLEGECNTEDHPRWDAHPTHYGTDDFGFSAFPAGNRHAGGPYGNILTDGYWWTTTEEPDPDDEAYLIFIYNSEGKIDSSSAHKGNGLSVRCIKDN